MGVYINMEMPENCALCPVWDAGNCLAASEAIICEYTKRPADCPLVPVPPHEDLIDRDALSNTIEQHYKHLKINRYDRDLLLHYLDVEMAPAIIPAEEVYSQFTDTAGNFHWCGTHSGEHTIKAKEGET